VSAPHANRKLDEQPSLPEKVIVIHEAFGEARIPYALGGALALAYYAEPRATIDIDANVFLPVERWRDVADVLGGLGVNCDGLEPAAVERDGQFRLWWGDNPVDLFFAYDPIHDEMQRQARRVPFGGMTVPILAPEHLIVCKAMFDRRKDWLDIEQMLIATEELDASAIEDWLTKMVGTSDPRLERLRELRAAMLEEN
jgi:hypothetical protein